MEAQLAANLYSLPGRLYQTIETALTFGQEETLIKRPGVRLLSLQPGQTVLDWGCGPGLLLAGIADELKEGTIIGLDRSFPLVSHARSKRLPAFKGHCYFVVCDGCEGLCLSEPVDAVVASFTLGTTTPEACERAIGEIHAILKPGGKLLILDMYRPQTVGLFDNLYYSVYGYVASQLFQQSFLGAPLRLAKGRFDQAAFQEHPSWMSFAWVGKKTDGSTPDARNTTNGSDASSARVAITNVAREPNDQRVPARLLEMLVCPFTKSQLVYDEERQELISRAAELAFPIRDGIPVMLREEARTLDGTYTSASAA